MRTIAYKCDRCRKPLTAKSAIKLNISIQPGAGSVEKKPLDFCKKCFVLIKYAFKEAMLLSEEEQETVDAMVSEAVDKAEAMQNKEPDVPETVQNDKEPEVTEKVDDVQDIKEPEKTDILSDKEPETADDVQDKGPEVTDSKNAETADAIQDKEPKVTDSKDTEQDNGTDDGMGYRRGRLTNEEKKEIIHLSRDEKVKPDAIAKKLNRPLKSVMRVLESAEWLDVESLKIPPKRKAESEMRASGEMGNINMGALSDEEKQEILRLHVEEGLDPYEIGERIGRLPRGVKRTINTAVKSGELDRMREAFNNRDKNPVKEEEPEQGADVEPIPSAEPAIKTEEVPEHEDDVPEQNVGSGASNAGIVQDSYTAPPKRVTVNRKRYDVGCILALAKAGWPPFEIAEEKHYDVKVVRAIMKKYM